MTEREINTMFNAHYAPTFLYDKKKVDMPSLENWHGSLRHFQDTERSIEAGKYSIKHWPLRRLKNEKIR